jgi:hypothetical protein
MNLLLRLPVLFLAALFLIEPARAAVADGSAPKQWPANAQKHQVQIRREAADESLRAAITAAEALPPSAEAAPPPPAPDASKPAGPANWWDSEKLGIRIPVAVTADAVAYYEKLVAGYARQPYTRYVEPSSRLDYVATAAFHASYTHANRTFTNVRVVTLKLTFSQNFASTQTEGMHFTKERTVVLDADGKPLLILGDGPTDVPVLAI